jgi:hypothetical protein
MTKKKPIGSVSSRTSLVSVGNPQLVRHEMVYNKLSSALAGVFDEFPYGEMAHLESQSALYAAAFSEGTQEIERRVNELRIAPSPASLVSRTHEQSLEERLFDATANVKILTSQIAMHLAREWRDKLFRQLDSLHDPKEWEPEDEPVRQASFATFLKAIIQIKPRRRPGLGLTHTGNLIAAWTEKTERLTVEFLPNDRVRWVIGRLRDDEPEHIAGQTHVSRLPDALAPYEPAIWFSA